MIELICHLLGDYVIQSDWMASEKTKRSLAALAHAVTYTLPFLFLTRSWKALAFIAVTHFIIDRWRLARYVCWAKNWLAPPRSVGPCDICDDPPKTKQDGPFQWWIGHNAMCKKRRNWAWKDCVATGYGPDKPPWLAVWLLIIADNTMHLICNALALRHLG